MEAHMGHPICVRLLTGLILGKSYSGSHSFRELMSTESCRAQRHCLTPVLHDL